MSLYGNKDRRTQHKRRKTHLTGNDRMENSIYLGLSKQQVLQTDMQIIANNVANMSTPGYRGQNTLFEEYISDPRGADDELSFVNDRVAYTRDGSFQTTPDGTLVTSAGFPVSGGISIPEGSGEISIDSQGVVSNDDGQLGQIQIVEFENVQTLEPMGNNLYRNDGPSRAAENTTVTQAALEGSNVNSVLEMTRMIETMRNFQSMQKVMDNENERMRGAIRKLTGSQ